MTPPWASNVCLHMNDLSSSPSPPPLPRPLFHFLSPALYSFKCCRPLVKPVLDDSPPYKGVGGGRWLGERPCGLVWWLEWLQGVLLHTKIEGSLPEYAFDTELLLLICPSCSHMTSHCQRITGRCSSVVSRFENQELETF